MSISGSQETKTAILQQSAAAGGDEELSLDAQEDREIVGFSITTDVDPGEAAPDLGRARVRLFIGTEQFTEQADADVPESNTRDNVSFHTSFVGTAMDDDTNNKAAAGENHDSNWFGHGSGVEWNEDATITLRVRPLAGSAKVRTVVWYREL